MCILCINGIIIQYKTDFMDDKKELHSFLIKSAHFYWSTPICTFVNILMSNTEL